MDPQNYKIIKIKIAKDWIEGSPGKNWKFQLVAKNLDVIEFF